MPYQPTLNFKLSDGRDLGSLGWITKEYLMSVYPQIANQLITPELWTWGRNNAGQLGVNGYGGGTNRTTPTTTFLGGSNWRQISSGGYHTAAIKNDGTLWTWGRNFFGQLGDNTGYQRNSPVTTFAGGTTWRQVACGYRHTAAIKTDGTLWTWGYNYYGELGINTGTNSLAGGGRTTPVTTFAGGTNWKQVACGNYHTAAIKTDGTLWNWGKNYAFGAGGVLGLNFLGSFSDTSRSTPVTTVAGGTNWKQVSCGYQATMAVKTDGTLWGWGAGNQGMLGDNSGGASVVSPRTTFAGGTNWKQVSLGIAHGAAVKTDGTLWTWGGNSFGQLGTLDTTQRNSPVPAFFGGTTWYLVSCAYHTAAVKTDGTLWVWGRNTNAELGINDTTNRNSPVTTFLGGTNWKQVSTGNYHTAAIRTSDDLQGI